MCAHTPRQSLIILTSFGDAMVAQGGQVATEPWMASSAALIEAHYPGQEGGRALADLLFDANGAGSTGWGRLVYSFCKIVILSRFACCPSR